MDYIRTEANGQLAFSFSKEFLKIPSTLCGFQNTDTIIGTSVSGREILCFEGSLNASQNDSLCPKCGTKMHINQHYTTTLRHLPFGSTLSCVRFDQIQYLCPCCHNTEMQTVPFKAVGHRITKDLLNYTEDLLSGGHYTMKEVSELTGLGRNTVKEIDKCRLQKLYTVGGTRLCKPDRYARFLGIDEFKLHNGRRYATHIIDMETGHILWIAKGKKKQVVYDFARHVGQAWMDRVEAVACDMNADFAEAFEEVCPHIQPVFDHFHIIKNFNDKVVSEVRKDEQRRLLAKGDQRAAKALKHTRYILTASRKTLIKRDKQAREQVIVHRGSPLFHTDDVIRTAGQEARYDALLKENQLLFTIDIIKQKLELAYHLTSEIEMSNEIIDIMDICHATGNRHFLWFERLLASHFEGIIAHATYQLSSGKVEGINNKIKTLRRQGYGYPDDEYFFLKLFDLSRRTYTRNVKSHKFCA